MAAAPFDVRGRTRTVRRRQDARFSSRYAFAWIGTDLFDEQNIAFDRWHLSAEEEPTLTSVGLVGDEFDAHVGVDENRGPIPSWKQKIASADHANEQRARLLVPSKAERQRGGLVQMLHGRRIRQRRGGRDRRGDFAFHLLLLLLLLLVMKGGFGPRERAFNNARCFGRCLLTVLIGRQRTETVERGRRYLPTPVPGYAVGGVRRLFLTSARLGQVTNDD